MWNIRKFQLLSIALVASLILSLLYTTAVIADDDVPPAVESPAGPVVDEPPADEVVEQPQPVVDEPPADEVVEQPQPVVDEPPADEVVEQPQLADKTLLEQIPQETEVVVVVNGQVEPLASQFAANVFVAGDPIWCPDGDAPTPGMGNCTDTYFNLFDLIEDIDNGILTLPAQDGVIWITGGNDSSSAEILIDGASPEFAALSGHALTIQGGWNGVSGNPSASDTSVFFVPISIINWNAAITLNQITVNGSSYLTPSNGLEVQTGDDVFLNKISIINNKNIGISVEAGGSIEASNLVSSGNLAAGADFSALGDVTLLGANGFLNNVDGLLIDAGGNIDVENITASENQVAGATLTSTSGGVTLGGFNFFELNPGSTGLSVEAAGDIDIQNLTANQNGGNGASLLSTGGDILLRGVNVFYRNLDNGLLAEASGDIDIDSVSLTATRNGSSGVNLISVSQSVSVIGGANIFNANDREGLFVDTLGDVDLENISAVDNGAGAEITLGGSFAMTGFNVFNENTGSGLYVNAGGNIDVKNITASNNGLSGYATGAELYSASGDVYLLGDNQFIDNLNNGLYIEARNGSITAENITASSNGIGTSYAPGAELIAAGLNLTGNNVFEWNNNTGLYAEISGDITITNLNASNNGRSGTYGPGAELYSTGKVTITGRNVFSGNSSEGLIIDADGDISVTNVDALNNGGSGLAFGTNVDAYVDCGSVLNNGDVQIDTSMAKGTLTLSGVNFGGDPEQNVGIDESQLTLINGCFSYPQREGYGSGRWSPAPRKVKYVSAADGQNLNLDCVLHEGTYVLLEDGNGAIIPCPIIGTAKLGSVEEITPYKILPDMNKFISGINLAISGESLIPEFVDDPQIVWYFNGTSDISGSHESVYWDGEEWVDTTEQMSLVTIFFVVPEGITREDLAILYWDGSNWAELANETDMGQVRVVSGLGYNENSGYFQVNVNFTGIFVLAQK